MAGTSTRHIEPLLTGLNPTTIPLQTSAAQSGASASLTAATKITLQTSPAVSAAQNVGLVVPIELRDSPTAFLNDTFTDADGTAITSHTGEQGTPWTLHPSYTGGSQIQTNRLEGNSAGAHVYYASATPASPDYDVTAVVRQVTAASTSAAGPVGRLDTASDTYYQMVLAAPFGTFWLLQKVVAGVSTTLATYVPGAISNGTEFTARLSMRGNVITGYVDGVRRFQVEDNSISAAGRAGVTVTGGTSSTGFHLSSVEARDDTALVSGGQSNASMTIYTPLIVPLQTSAAQSAASAALSAKTGIPLQTSAAQSDATAALSAPTRITLQASAAQSAATATILISTTIPLQTSAAQSAASAAFTAKTAIPLQTSAAQSAASAVLSAQTRIPLQTSAAQSAASAALAARANLALQTSAAQSGASAVLTTQAGVSLQTSSAQSAASALLKAQTRIPLQVSAGQSTAQDLNIHVPHGVPQTGVRGKLLIGDVESSLRLDGFGAWVALEDFESDHALNPADSESDLDSADSEGEIDEPAGRLVING